MFSPVSAIRVMFLVVAQVEGRDCRSLWTVSATSMICEPVPIPAPGEFSIMLKTYAISGFSKAHSRSTDGTE